MKMQRLALVVTVINLALMVVLLSTFRRAQADEVAPVLRGRMLEIVDAQGRVRASISVHEPVTVNSKWYPDTVVLRLADQKSRPLVKLTAAENGSALGLSDDAASGVQLFARDTGSFVKVTDKKGHEQMVKP